MKKLTSILAFCALFVLMACNPQKTEEQHSETKPVAEKTTPKKDKETIRSSSFDELFRKITPEEIPGNVFTLVNKDFTVITAGTPADCNSMIASWGGWGTLFNKPVTWCFLRANRFTLEYIQKELTYTMSYFDEDDKEDIMIFGTQSGRNSDKMKEHKLTMVQTPDGNITYKEAKLIIECKLTEVTTVSPDDFLTDEGKEFITSAYAEVKAYHKLVFGDITNVWERK